MARGRGQQLKSAGDRDVGEVKVCPLCIEPLDTDEQQFYPCPCGYQVCLFCYEKLKLFCNNLCPGCRTEYGSQKDPHDPIVRQPPTLAEAVTAKQVAQPHPSHPSQPRGTAKGDQPGPSWPAPTWAQQTDQQPPLLSANAADPTSAWPSLAASQRQVQPQASASQQPPAAWQQQQPLDLVQGSATAGQSGKQVTVTLPAPLDARQEPSVQADPEGAALLRTVQSAVGNGHLSIEEGTKQLVAFLRQREQAQGSSSKPGGKAFKPPPGFAGAVSQPHHPVSESPTLLQTAQQVLDPHPPTASTSSSDALLSTPESFQQRSVGASMQQPSATSSGKAAGSAAFTFPVDMVAASAALWLAPVTSDSKQLLSLRLHAQKDPPMLRRRRGPLYARTGNTKLGASDQQPATASDGKLSSQQAQWFGLGNGLGSSHLHSRNGYSPVGFPNGPGQQELANGLPGNGNTSANTSSHAA